jgi:hypothetical protein
MRIFSMSTRASAEVGKDGAGKRSGRRVEATVSEESLRI